MAVRDWFVVHGAGAAGPAASQVAAPIGHWIPASQAAQVAGRAISGGMFYLGRHAPPGGVPRAGRGPDPALVDPALDVDWRNPDWHGRTMGYWPSYGEITPACRAAYLSWLAGGRDHPSAPIGYVFLYYYGLERRVLRDTDGPRPTSSELAAIAAEVRRLLDVYGGNGSFASYATDFLDLLDATSLLVAPLEPPRSDELEGNWEVPLAVRIALARYAAANMPVPAAWARALVRSHPESYLRTPATRCVDEFDVLFALRYRARHGAGLVVAPSAARIRVHYTPASAAFDGTYEATLGDLPDVSGASGPLAVLKDLASECCDALDAYSRYLGRNPDGRGAPGAVALLPDELLASHGGEVVGELRTWTAERLDPTGPSGHALVALDDLVERWSPGRTAKLAKADAVALAGLLGRLGVGIEPDVRFGGSTPKPGSATVLFRLAEGATAAPSPAYSAAATLVHLAAVVSAADGTVDDHERAHLARHLQEVLGLDPAERSRLAAHLAWLVASEAGLAGLKRRLSQLTTDQRTAIGQLMVGLAGADGRVTPDEISVLAKVHRLLGLDETEVYSTIHALGTADPGPVTVRATSTPTPRWAIPEPGADAATARTVTLDPDKVRARLAETATVTALLAGIFVDDDVRPAAGDGEPALASSDGNDMAPPSGPSLAGLDEAHSGLADRLRTRPSWPRGQAEDAAAALGLPLLDGALDRINEAALDLCGEPLTEGDDPIELNIYASEELFA